jgi:hypothetical protein
VQDGRSSGHVRVLVRLDAVAVQGERSAVRRARGDLVGEAVADRSTGRMVNVSYRPTSRRP